VRLEFREYKVKPEFRETLVLKETPESKVSKGILGPKERQEQGFRVKPESRE